MRILRAHRHSRPNRGRRRGQSLVEFALVAPILLLVFAAAADFGRVFYAYVAIENAAKEGALFGSRAPLCDGPSNCPDPNNVRWRVQAELDEQGIRNPDGTELTPTVTCLSPAGTPRAALTDCAAGDTYQVGLSYPFKMLTPILGDIIGDLALASSSRAVVFNLAFDPTPGASINKFVSPTGAVNQADIIAKCLEPDDTDAAGYYRSPCRDSSTAEPNDFLTLRFEEGTAIGYRIVVGNNGAQQLTGVTVSDSQGSTGCSFPSSLAVGAVAPVCNYSRNAPVVASPATSMDYDNIATIDSAQTDPATAGVRVTVEKPPAKLQVAKWISPFALGDDGDGAPSFGTDDDLTVTYRTGSQVTSGTVWFKLIVRNTGGQTATGLAVADSRGAIPLSATCPAVPATLAAGARWECRYSIPYTSATSSVDNTVTATATNVIADSDDSHTARLRIESCAGSGNRTVPNLIGLVKTAAQAAWTNAGFTGTLTAYGPDQPVVTQSRPAYECVSATSTMTITRTTTP